MSEAAVLALPRDANGVLHAQGAITFATAGDALHALNRIDKAGTSIDLDLSQLRESDSATLAVLIAWVAHARRSGTTLRYVRAPIGLRRLAQLSEVDGLIGI